MRFSSILCGVCAAFSLAFATVGYAAEKPFAPKDKDKKEIRVATEKMTMEELKQECHIHLEKARKSIIPGNLDSLRKASEASKNSPACSTLKIRLAEKGQKRT